MLSLRTKKAYANFLFRERKIKIILIVVLQVERVGQMRLLLVTITQMRKKMLLVIQVELMSIILATIT